MTPHTPWLPCLWPRRDLGRPVLLAWLLALLPAGICLGQGTTTTFGTTTTDGAQTTYSAQNTYAAQPTYGATTDGTQAGDTPKPPALQSGPITLTFGGFIELAAVWRNRNETADIGSTFSGIPFGNSAQSRVSEFRFSARQSRLSLLAQAEPFAGARAEAYVEADFLGAAPTSNSVESNSYTPRLRHAYARLGREHDWYFLAGQTWSLANLYKHGLEPRDEDVPLTIDPQYVVGFDWTRDAQLRVVKRLNDVLSIGLSLESPQAVIAANNIVPATATLGGTLYTLSNPYPGTIYNNTGGSLFAPTTTYSLDVAPDIILKGAADTGFGHYEVYGLGRFFRSSVDGRDQTTFGGGIGAGGVIPLIPSVLQLQASGLWGRGIGRYGSGQLSDVTVRPDGTLATLTAYHVLFGLQYTPTSLLTLYSYLGREQTSSQTFIGQVEGTSATGLTALFGPYAYGYGSPAYNNSGCYTLGATACAANTRALNEVAVGGWLKYYQGPLGNLQFGLQAAYVQRDAFAGVGGAPVAGIFITEASFRFYPYQR